MTITFIDPTKTKDPNSKRNLYNPDTPGDFDLIPQEPGVYIWGLKVKVEDEARFIPCYVGETGRDPKKGGLQKRLEKHYHGLRSGVNYRKELFDFSATSYSKEDVQKIYRSMCAYDTVVNPAEGRQKLDLAIHVPDLIYWQDDRFLYDKCGKPRPTFGTDRNQREAIDLLRQWKSEAQDLLARIENTKQNFEKHFYFIYSTQMAGLKTTQVEHATKNALKSVWVFTTADAKGKYPQVIIQLPTQTRMVHDLWSPPGVRSIKVVAR